MQKYKFLAAAVCLWVVFSSSYPATVKDKVSWVQLKDISSSLAKEKRPVLIDIYTDWCGWCKVMDNKTYSNRKVSDYLRDKYYAVKFNAETRDDVMWSGRTFRYNPDYRCNDFAIYASRGQLAFPTTVIFPADGSEPQAISGYLPTKDFEMIIKYFGEGQYGKIPFEDYQKKFKSAW